MSAAARGPDLGFLSAEEARAIFHVLQRDAELRRAERHRVRKLLKRKTSETGLQGVTGEWFEEIQRKKFHNNSDVNRMLKQPLEHQLRKNKKANDKEFKMSSHTSPQAQKNTSASFLGFRSPFAWLFSFRKSRKHQTLKEPRYDCSASASPKVEEMAAAETYNSPTSAEPSCHSFDAHQDELMEETPQEWNEQLEKEFFRVLDDLDDQLAQEQAREPVDRTVPPQSVQGSRAAGASEAPAAVRGQRGAAWGHPPSAFFPDGLRTIRAKDEHKIFIRPRKLQSAYINWHRSAFKDDCKYGDPADGNPHVLSSRLSSISYGQSSEGSLYPPSVAQNSGFRHKHYMDRGTVGRSYSVCSLRRCSSSVSSEQRPASALQYPLARESNDGFIPRFSRQNPKRIPLSSIVWNNTPDSAAQTSAQEKVFRTQSLLEFQATDRNRYPSPLQESRKYACYLSKHHYRRSLSSSNCFSRVSCPDKAASPLPFDNWENYPSYKSENNLSRSCYRDTSPHGKLYINQKNSPYGKKDNYPFWADIPPYHNDKVFVSPDASFEAVMANLNDRQWTHTKNAKYATQRLQSDFHLQDFQYSPENTGIKKITRSVSNRTFSEFTESCQPWLSCNSPVSSCFTRSDEPVFPESRDQSKPLGQNSTSVLVTQRGSEMGLEQLDDVQDKNLLDEAAIKDMTLLPVSQQADTTYTNTQSFPCSNSASAILPNSSSLFSQLRSKGQPQVATRREAVRTDTSNNNKSNVQMKGNDLPPSRGFIQLPCVLPADESGKESFLPSQKPWEHNLCYATNSITVDDQSTEIVNQVTAKGESSLVDVGSAPSTETLGSHQGTALCPERSCRSPQRSSSQALSHKDNLRRSETLTNSSATCTVTESQAEGGNTTQVSRTDAAKKISQKIAQSPSTLVTRECNRPFTTSCPQNETSGHIYTHSFGDPRISEHSLNFCLEEENGNIRDDSACIEGPDKQGSSPGYTSSCSIAGSHSRSNPKSSDPLVIYYTLPRKSASVAGSIMSDTAISFPRESRTSTQERFRMEAPNRTDAFCSPQSFSCSDSEHSLTAAPLTAASGVQDGDYPFTRRPNDSVSSSTSVGLTDSCNDLIRGGYSGFSDCKEKGNCLQKYKTTSTFTVCVDEDHIKYHELVSIYYTLPRRHSRTFCNLFRDNPEDTELPLPKAYSQSPRIHNKKNEGRVSLANVFFPNTLEKEVPSCSPDQVPSAVAALQNAATAAGSIERSSPLPPSPEEGCAAQAASTAQVRKDTSPALPLAKRALPDTRTADVPSGDPQPAAAVGNAGEGVSGASSHQSTEKCLKEKENLQTTPSKADAPIKDLSSSTSVSRKSVQKGNSEHCCQPAKANPNKSPNSLLLRTRVKGSLGRSSNSNVPGPPAEDKCRDNVEVKRREGLRHVPPLCSNKCSGLQLRTASSRSSRNDLMSCGKRLSEWQNKGSVGDMAASAKPSLQLDKTGSTGAGEPKNSKMRSAPSVQDPETGAEGPGLQESQGRSEGGLDTHCQDGALGAAPDEALARSAEGESKLLSGRTGDKAKDIEKRKNRPSIKNKLAAVYKTSRKFSSRNLPPKPHISNIFSQNDGSAAAVEADVPRGPLPPADGTRSSPRSANENQSRGPEPGGSAPVPRAAGRNRNENDRSLPAKNANWRSVTSSYTQKEATSPPKNTAKAETRPGLSGQAVSADKKATRNKNAQTLSLGLENRGQVLSPRAPKRDAVDDEGRAGSGSGCSPPSPLLTDKNANPFTSSHVHAEPGPEQSPASEAARGERQDESKGLRSARSEAARGSRARPPRERHLSESARAPRGRLPAGGRLLPRAAGQGRRFSSYSELPARDENENWAPERGRAGSTRSLLYPSVEFGIFGKEQQLAFLENIKRSLTEGRLWRPCLLNNPGSLRDGESPSLGRSELWSSSSAGSKMSSAASSPREWTEMGREGPAPCSDSDTDTTTDDEYYLDEADKESEL